jgi:hypothetical protein
MEKEVEGSSVVALLLMSEESWSVRFRIADRIGVEFWSSVGGG